MNKRVKVGIIGVGGIAGAHAPGFQAAEELGAVVAVAEPDANKVPRARELFGENVEVYDDYVSLLKQADVDAVDILLPHDLHCPAAIAAAEAGKHVMVEKVMARNVWECDQMIQACAAHDVTLTVCHDRRYDAEWIALKEIVDSGALGEIAYWKLDHNQDVNAAACLPWAASKDRLGGGAIMSCLTHQIDALRWYGGEVNRVNCMTKVVPDRMEGETIGVITAEMASGALAQLSINWMTQSNHRENGLWYEMVQVCGTQGEAYYMSNRGTFLYLKDDRDPLSVVSCETPIPDAGFAKAKVQVEPGHVGCVREWLRLLRGEASAVTTTGEDVRGTVEVAEAAYRSVESGSAVALPIEPQPWQ